jgi:RNA polymerase sigma factor (TIGR02999 family)
MSDVIQLLDAAAAGNSSAAAELLPLVYAELRRLAAHRLAEEKPGQTLQATELVHEVYLRLVGSDPSQPWNGRGHFFAAAAEAMRRILVESARRKNAEKRGGGLHRHDASAIPIAGPEPSEDLVALDEALDQLATTNKQAADLVQLRYFAGLSLPDAAAALDMSERSAGRLWAYARAWLRRAVEGESAGNS